MIRIFATTIVEQRTGSQVRGAFASAKCAVLQQPLSATATGWTAMKSIWFVGVKMYTIIPFDAIKFQFRCHLVSRHTCIFMELIRICPSQFALRRKQYRILFRREYSSNLQEAHSGVMSAADGIHFDELDKWALSPLAEHNDEIDVRH